MTAEPTPPWRDQPEADYMPSLRRHFADGLDGRFERADRALGQLRAGVCTVGPDGMLPAKALHLFAHSLTGTAPGVGGIRIGEAAHPLTELTRHWPAEHPPAEDALVEAGELLEIIRKEARLYRRWVEEDEAG